MLGRNSSTKLGRRKSTSSNQSKHESIDPSVARQQAQAAATLAFARAQERNSADGGHSGGLSRTNTSNYQEQQQSNNNQARGVRRQHSVRFVGPTAVQRRQSMGPRTPPIKSQHSVAPPKPIAITTDTPVPAAYRPPSRSSSLGKASLGRATKDNFAAALADYGNYYTHEDEAPSTPSSYRRIRRSKSMFSPLKAPQVFYSNGTPDRPEGSNVGRDYQSNFQTPHSQSIPAPLRAPKSMSFLRGGRDHMTAAIRERNDVAVQMARDRFFHQASQQRLREQPSFLFRSKAQRQEKPFRKSVRSSSGNDFGLPIASDDQNQPQKEFGLKEAARKASQSIRSRFKRVFGRSKEEPVAIPNQQVDARETHVRDDEGGPINISGSPYNIPHPDEASLTRVARRVPSLHPMSSNQQLRSHAGSIKSFRSEHSNDGSRVTSWNSTGVNTVASQTARNQAERDHQRLSIINENGTHLSSSSLKRPRASSQLSTYHGPNKTFGQASIPAHGPVNAARLVSALMQRLDESSPDAKLEASRNASLESLTVSRQGQFQSSSADRRPVNRSPATIRRVPTEASTMSSRGRAESTHDHQWARSDSVYNAQTEVVLAGTGVNVHQWAAADSLREARMRNGEDVFSRESIKNKENIPFEQLHNATTPTLYSVIPGHGSTKSSYHTVPENIGITPQELAIRNEPIIQGGKMLRESRSTFFGGSTFTISRAQSPFRRALAENDYKPQSTVSEPLVPVTNSLQPNPLFLSPGSAASLGLETPEIEGAEKAYSESNYSRTTSGRTPVPADSPLPFPIADIEVSKRLLPDTGSGTGAVTILDRTTYRPVMPVNRGHRVISSASSNEWKSWMSSEVAKLEKAKEHPQAPSYVNYALPTMPRSFHAAGHVREKAQRSEDDIEVAQKNVVGVKQPLGIIQQNTNHRNPPVLRPILKNSSAVSLVEKMESTKPAPIPVPPPLPPPPIPVRSPLRHELSKTSMRSVATVRTIAGPATAPNSVVKASSMSGRNMLHKRNASSATLRSMKSIGTTSIKSVETPAKIVKRSRDPSLSRNSTRITDESREKTWSMRSRHSVVPSGRENIAATKGKVLVDDIYNVEGAGLLGPSLGPGWETGIIEVESAAVETSEVDAQVLGSKRMVDMFLSSRRKRIVGGSEEGTAVFL